MAEPIETADKMRHKPHQVLAVHRGQVYLGTFQHADRARAQAFCNRSGPGIGTGMKYAIPVPVAEVVKGLLDKIDRLEKKIKILEEGGGS